MVAFALAVGVARSAAAQVLLRCGDALSGSLQGNVDVYTVEVAAGSKGFIQGSFTSGGDDDTLRIHVTGNGVDIETCRNVAEFESRGGPLRVEVSPCADGRGDYVINAHVISSSGDNCGRLLACGATPDGLELDTSGEVDSFRFPGLAGGEVELRVEDLDDRADAYLVRVFEPDGNRIFSACDDVVAVPTASSRDYSVLVSACGSNTGGAYRIERYDGRCPQGPVITAMAFLPDSRVLVLPSSYDAQGRAVYESSGDGTLIVEGRTGKNFRGIGSSAFGVDQLPPFQAIVSRPMGNGNPAICDQGARPAGGIAATVPLTFRNDRASIDRINDLGCRFDNGQGEPVGRRDPLNSCERFSFSFVDPTTDIQFCATIAQAESFPPGDTILAARMGDLDGVVGAAREIVIRVTGSPEPTASFTPTPTRRSPTATRPATATPTRRPTSPPATRPPGPCTCDCDFNSRVRVSELTRCVRISQGTTVLAECRNADRNGDGKVFIGELVEGVRNALVGCPPAPIEN